MIMRNDLSNEPLLSVRNLTKYYGERIGCNGVSFDLYEGEILAVVGESGSGKSTLLSLLSTELAANAGTIRYRMRDGVARDLSTLSEAEQRLLLRTDWGFVRQDSTQGLRMSVSAGG